jgi:two-component system response regulator PilR (NtrC family)
LQLAPEALRALCAYSFPGNVRELENILERASALCADSLIAPEDLRLSADGDEVDGGEAGAGDRRGETLDDHLNRVERQAIVEALAKTGFNRTAAARLLGVTFRSLRYRIERLGIEE